MTTDGLIRNRVYELRQIGCSDDEILCRIMFRGFLPSGDLEFEKPGEAKTFIIPRDGCIRQIEEHDPQWIVLEISARIETPRDTQGNPFYRVGYDPLGFNRQNVRGHILRQGQ